MPEVYENGAKRSEKRLRYDLITKQEMDALARRYTMGSVKYGDDNWKKGGPEFFRDVPNHLIYHLWDAMHAMHGIESDETTLGNWEAVMWNAGKMVWWEDIGRKQWELKV